ncbi:MAG: AEC family transporter [Alphaproteobacteria bacterium]
MLFLFLLKNNIPIFAAVLFGYFCSYFHILGKRATSVLTDFVFFVALPCMVLYQFSRHSIDKIFNGSYMTVIAIASLILAAIGAFFGRKIFKQKLSETALTLMSTGQVNTAYLAIPIFLLFFKTVAPVVMVSVFQQLVISSLVLGLIEFDLYKSSKKQGFTRLVFLKELPKALMKTPIIPASLVGLVFSYCHWSFPSPVSYFFDLMGTSAAPLSLFVLGLSLQQDKITFRDGNFRQQIFTLLFLKNIFHPLLAFCLGKFVFNLSPFWLVAASLMAAMPTARNCALFAQRYGLDVQRSNTLIVLSTLLSFVIINLILYVLGDLSVFTAKTSLI